MSWSRTGVDLATRVRDVYQTYVRHLHRELAARGFSDVRPAHSSVFQYLDPGGTSLTDLAERAGLTRQAIWYLVNELEDAGYVHRVVDTTDRRRKLVRLTDRGAVMSRVARSAVTAVERAATRRLGRPAADDLRRQLDGLLDALRDVDPAPPQRPRTGHGG